MNEIVRTNRELRKQLAEDDEIISKYKAKIKLLEHDLEKCNLEIHYLGKSLVDREEKNEILKKDNTNLSIQFRKALQNIESKEKFIVFMEDQFSALEDRNLKDNRTKNITSNKMTSSSSSSFTNSEYYQRSSHPFSYYIAQINKELGKLSTHTTSEQMEESYSKMGQIIGFLNESYDKLEQKFDSVQVKLDEASNVEIALDFRCNTLREKINKEICEKIIYRKFFRYKLNQKDQIISKNLDNIEGEFFFDNDDDDDEENDDDEDDDEENDDDEDDDYEDDNEDDRESIIERTIFPSLISDSDIPFDENSSWLNMISNSDTSNRQSSFGISNPFVSQNIPHPSFGNPLIFDINANNNLPPSLNNQPLIFPSTFDIHATCRQAYLDENKSKREAEKELKECQDGLHLEITKYTNLYKHFKLNRNLNQNPNQFAQAYNNLTQAHIITNRQLQVFQQKYAKWKGKAKKFPDVIWFVNTSN